MQIHIATGNAGKLRDFAAAAAPQGIAILPLPGLAAMPEPTEDAPDFAGNAALKAVAYSRLAPGLLVLADDSGLEVDALEGRPGVRSARLADDLHFLPDAGLGKEERNNLCLLSLLLGNAKLTQPSVGWRARFHCELALAREGQVLRRAQGTVEGEILSVPRGKAGFGYDPLFLLPELGLTLAELTPEAKWKVSHRGLASRSLLAQIAEDRSPDHFFAQNDR